MIEYKGIPGQTIYTVIEEMVQLAKDTNDLVICEFNGIVIQATKYMSKEVVMDLYRHTKEAIWEAYYCSDEYFERRRLDEIKVMEKYEKYDMLMKDFEKLNFNDKFEVLNWIKSITLLTDMVEICRKNKEISDKFKDLRFVSGVNCGDAYIKGDIDNNYRYLIGQLISGIESTGYIHPIMTKFIEDFMKIYS